MIPVAGNAVQVALGHQRRLGKQVALLLLGVLHPALQKLNHARALGQHDRQTLTHHVHGGEVLKVAAQLVVVALQRFLALGDVGVQLFLGGEGGAVDALKHLVLLAAAPVRAGDAGQLHGLHLAGGGQMRARAQVGEIALTVEGNRRVLGQIVDQLDLVRLVLHQFQRFRTGQLKALQTLVLLDDAGHFLFDGGQILVCERGGDVEIVVEAVVDGGADGQLRLGADGLHGLRQHVAGGVAEHAQTVRVAAGEELNGRAVRNGLYQLGDLAVYARGQRRLFQLLIDFTGHVQCVHAVRKLANFSLIRDFHVIASHVCFSGNKNARPSMKGRAVMPVVPPN